MPEDLSKFFDPKINITDVAILFANALVSLYFFKHRRKEERSYKSGIYFYQTFIVERLERFVHFAKDLEEIVVRSGKACQNSISAKHRDIVEKGDKQLHEKFIDLERMTLTLVKAYSKDLHKELFSASENYYDHCTQELASFDRLNGDSERIGRSIKKVSKARETYIDKTISAIQSKQPKIS